jgi:hypothetical protein
MADIEKKEADASGRGLRHGWALNAGSDRGNF